MLLIDTEDVPVPSNSPWEKGHRPRNSTQTSRILRAAQLQSGTGAAVPGETEGTERFDGSAEFG